MSYVSKYENKGNEIAENIFQEEYYSGSDVKVSINDTPIEVSSIQYTIQEQQKPIYGYASRTFDDLAVGTRIVFGNIMVPIKNNQKNNLNLKDLNHSDNILKRNKENKDIIIDSSNKIYDKFKENVNNNSNNNTSNTQNETLNNTSSNNNNFNVPDWIHYTKRNIGNNIRQHLSTIKYVNKDKNINNNIINDNIFNNDTYNIFKYKMPLQYDEKIKDIQAMLLKNGYNVDINGYYDLKTNLAIKKFQKKNNIDTTGNINKPTYHLLNLKFNKYNKTYITVKKGSRLKLGPFKISKSLPEILPYKTKLTILDSYNNFYKVKTNNNKIGYISKRCVFNEQ